MRPKPLALLGILALAGCGAAERLGSIGRPPKLTPVSDIVAPAYPAALGALGPVGREPPPTDGPLTPGSLYREGYAGFRDLRAYRVGDIVTVRINIADRAQLGNSTSRSRNGAENAALPNLLGLESFLRDVLPAAVNPASLVSGSSASTNSGAGQTQRAETVDLTLAAVVTNVLPNGNFIIRGRQEVRVNFELRELIIVGLVRPQDIARDNSVRHTQIAEARVSYGGKGHLTDAQQARWGQQIYDALFPF